jgi:hypothetical protein
MKLKELGWIEYIPFNDIIADQLTSIQLSIEAHKDSINMVYFLFSYLS